MNTLQDKGIPRVAIKDEWTHFEPIRGELFKNCAKRLGYKVADVTATERNSAALAGILKNAGIEPLSRKAVDRYQAAEEARANRFWLRLWSHITLAAIANGLWIYFMAIPKVTDWFEFVFPMVMGNFLIVGLAGGAAIWGPGGEWSWKFTSLKGYSKPIPEFALAYALAINEVNPHVGFKVEELKYRDRVADPFLTAHFGDRMYYIAVWDEPKFEGRKQK